MLADQDLRVYGARIDVLSTEFQVAWDALQDGGFSQAKFADELDHCRTERNHVKRGKQ